VKYNCSVSIALRSADGETAVAAGVSDFATGRPANASDRYAWGSVTKMVTAAAIMKLVSQGAFGLDSRVAPLVDPLLMNMSRANPWQNFTTLEDLWGANVTNTTIRQLLAMQDGMPDFDTAIPKPHAGAPTDPLRAKLYTNPDHVSSPTELMSMPWVRGHWKPCLKILSQKPGFCYSSTNFMVLGLVLLAHSGNATSWEQLHLGDYLPSYLRSQVDFATRGAPKDYGAVHGYDRTSYNVPRGEHSHHDNWDVDGVFAGWTASNLVASAPSVASLAWEIFGPPSSVAPREYVEQMVPWPGATHVYGLGAFNLGLITGRMGPHLLRPANPLGIGYGHIGATYGYQSIAGYFPKLNIALAISTNIETDDQGQPLDTMCHAYNAVVDVLLGQKSECKFHSTGYFGFCTCTGRESELIV